MQHQGRIDNLRTGSRLVDPRYSVARSGRIPRIGAGAALAAGLILLIEASPSAPVTQDWRLLGKMDRSAIPESSGLVKSRRHPGIFWTHNDSENEAKIFAIKLTGEIVAEVSIQGAANLDWEDIAIDDEGHLFIGDIGDNGRVRATKNVYRIPEPDPSGPSGRSVAVDQVLRYRYPDAKHDSEALFRLGDDLFVVSKILLGPPKIFRLPRHGEEVSTATPVCWLRVGMVTGADVSQDEKRLALCGYGWLWVYDLDGDLTELERATPRQIATPIPFQTEACAFDGDDVIITAESGEIWRVSLDDIEETHAP